MPAPVIGNEIPINETTTGLQLNPTVAATADGRFVVAWYDDVGKDYRVRQFDATGLWGSSEKLIQVGASDSIENRIELASLRNNDLAVVFHDTDNGGNIIYRNYEYSPEGYHDLQAESHSVAVHNPDTDEAGTEEFPFVVVGKYGLVNVGYSDFHNTTGFNESGVFYAGNQPADSYNIARPGDQVQLEGAPRSDDELGVITVFVNSATSGNVCIMAPDKVVGTGSHPHIAMLADGGYAVTWDGPAGNVLTRIYDVNGDTPAARTNAITVDGVGASQSHLCALQDGRFMVVWKDVAGSGASQVHTIFGRMYNANGSADSGAFVIDSLTGSSANIGAPRAAELADGRVVVTYQDGTTTNTDLSARFIDPRTQGVVVTGTTFDDDHVGSAFADLFFEGVGDDHVDGGGGNDTVHGGAGFDSLNGGFGNDNLFGDGGDDWLGGDYGNDTMTGGYGNDAYFADSGDRVLEKAGGGIDTVVAIASFKLEAGSHVELMRAFLPLLSPDPINLTGNELQQILQGNDGANVLDGRGGADSMQGYGGNDTYFVDNAGDAVTESAGKGTDTIITTVSHALVPGCSIELLRTLGSASSYAVNLYGNALANTIQGNGGANVLSGRLGNDTMSGFGGSDIFRFNAALGSTNVDRITDFNAAADTIQIDNAYFTGLANGTLAAGAFRIGSAAADASDRIIYNSATGALVFDSNGNASGGAVQFATLASGLSLTNADFVVI